MKGEVAEESEEQQQEERPPSLKASDTKKVKKVEDVDMKSCVESESEAEKLQNASVRAEAERSAKHRENAKAREKKGQRSVSRRRAVTVKRRQQATMTKDTMYREGAWYGGEERGGSVSTTDPIYEQQRIDGERGVQPPD